MTTAKTWNVRIVLGEHDDGSNVRRGPPHPSERGDADRGREGSTQPA